LSLDNPRLCAFCGKIPNSKNREHVLPQWALERTGDPSRVVTHGQNYAKSKEPIRYSWSNFVAPACGRCNSNYSALEDEAKRITRKLENREGVSVRDYVTLLDWLDKVRVGVWLLRHLIENHPIDITPNFYISGRVGTKDRMVALYVSEQPKGLSLFGSDSMIFSDMPSCFALRLNGLLMFNVSSDFFCSRGCGFPYPQSMKLLMGGESSGQMHLKGVSGPHKVSHPVTRFRLFKPVVWLYQAIKSPTVDPDFQGGYYGHVNLTDTRTIPLTLSGKGRLGALIRQFSDGVEVLNEPDQLIEFDNVTRDEGVETYKIVGTVYDTQVQLFSAIQHEWIKPTTPSEEFAAFRKLKIESTKQFADKFRNEFVARQT